MEDDFRYEIWLKGAPIIGMDPDQYRKDDYGYVIRFDEYQTHGQMAWEYEKRMIYGTLSEYELRPVSRNRLEKIFGRMAR